MPTSKFIIASPTMLSRGEWITNHFYAIIPYMNTPQPIKRKVGRPRKYETITELQVKIDQFFSDCEVKNAPLLITSLALALGLDRKALIEYKGQPEFSHAIKKAILMCEEWHERQLATGKNPVASIFWLKAIAKWQEAPKEQSEIPFELKIKKGKEKKSALQKKWETKLEGIQEGELVEREDD